MGVLNDWLEDRIRLDVSAFADPGTTIAFNETARWLQATWTQRSRTVTENFRVSTANGQDIVVRREAGRTQSYAAFLASDRMADLRSIAHNTTRAIRGVRGYVRPRVVVNDRTVRGNAEQELEILVQSTDPRTKLVFVTADAGVGKTTLLGELVKRKATDYALARTDALWLYVNAQGSSLARLDEALAKSLDDVRALFPYHAVAALVRAEALVLVIDGFDELIGAPGTYDDAYSSLASFLTSLDGNGTIVATARSAYYEQEFLTRIGTVPGLAEEIWTLTRVELLEWNQEERVAFLTDFARERVPNPNDRESFAIRVLETFEESGAGGLAAKPFFLARVAEFASDGHGLESGASLLDRLVNTYLARESKGKLLRAPRVPVLTEAQLAMVYEEIANEMWRQETRELSAASFRELINIISQLFELDDVGRAMVVDRLPNSAFVHPGSPLGSIAFLHEIFFAYFLARPIVQSIESGDPFRIATALRKGRLPNQAGDIIGREIVQKPNRDAILTLLGTASSAISIGAEQIRQNAGSIVSGMIRDGLSTSAALAALTLVDVDLSSTRISRLGFQDCVFRGVDLRGTIFDECSATACFFEAVLVNDLTVLDIRGPGLAEFRGLRYEAEDGRPVSIYAPRDAQKVLTRLQLPAAAQVVNVRRTSREVEELVAKVVRMFERANIASFDNDLERKRLQRDTNWPAVYNAFLDSGILREELRPAGGNQTTFVRMSVRPTDLMAGLNTDSLHVDERVTAFWDRVGAI